MNTIEDVKRDYRYVYEFAVEFVTGLFKRDADACLALSKTMGVDFKAVYRHVQERGNNNWAEGNITWDCETFYVINPKGKLVVFSNSEWGGVERVK